MSRIKQVVSLVVIYMTITVSAFADCTIGNLYPPPSGSNFDFEISPGFCFVFSSGNCSNDCYLLGTSIYFSMWTTCTWYFMEANSYGTGVGLAYDGRAIDLWASYGAEGYGYDNCDGSNAYVDQIYTECFF